MSHGHGWQQRRSHCGQVEGYEEASHGLKRKNAKTPRVYVYFLFLIK